MTRDQWNALTTRERAQHFERERQRGVDISRELRSPSGLLYAVPKRLANDALAIVTLPDPVVLGWIVRDSLRRLPQWSFVHGQYIHHYRVVDLLGQTWYGQGSLGLSVRFNRCKNSPEPSL